MLVNKICTENILSVSSWQKEENIVRLGEQAEAHPNPMAHLRGTPRAIPVTWRFRDPLQNPGGFSLSIFRASRERVPPAGGTRVAREESSLQR